MNAIKQNPVRPYRITHEWDLQAGGAVRCVARVQARNIAGDLYRTMQEARAAVLKVAGFAEYDYKAWSRVRFSVDVRNDPERPATRVICTLDCWLDR